MNVVFKFEGKKSRQEKKSKFVNKQINQKKRQKFFYIMNKHIISVYIIFHLESMTNF